MAFSTWRMLTVGERLQVAILAVAMVVNGFLQSFSLAVLLPFIGLILDPTAVRGTGYLGTASRWLGNPDPGRLLIWSAFAVFAAIVVKNAFNLVYTHWLNRLVAAVERRVAVELLDQCMAAPYVWFLSKNTAVLVMRVMGDVVTWARSGLKSILSLTSNSVTMISIVALLVSINPLVGTPLVLAGALFSLGATGLLRPYLRRMATRKHLASIEATKIVNQALAGAKDIKASGTERFFVDEFAAYYDVFSRNAARPLTLQPIPGYIVEIAVALVIVMIGLYVAGRPAVGPDLVALVAIYGVAVVRLLPLFNHISATVTSVQTALPSIETIHLMRAELVAFERHHDTPLEPTTAGSWARLELQDVRYRYPEGHGNALYGVTLTLERGARIGVVGRSGSGKTTLVDVLMGLLTPSSGRLLIDGWEVGAEAMPAWRRQIGYVPQHPFIVDASLRFNVALGVDRAAIDDTRVRRALETAGFGDVLRSELGGRLDSTLGERGVRLSGGQRQRVAIARALYRDTSLLILDEATSALDAESERSVSMALRQIPRQTTVLIVAHRLSTVKDCDRIIVLDMGRIVGYDSHSNLIRDCPLYRRFVELGDLALAEVENGLEPAEAPK